MAVSTRSSSYRRGLLVPLPLAVVLAGLLFAWHLAQGSTSAWLCVDSVTENVEGHSVTTPEVCLPGLPDA